MGLASKLVKHLPLGRLRGYFRDYIDTELRGVPPAILKYRDSQLRPNLDMVISHFRVNHSRVCFLQIGAFDGTSGDPIYPLLEKHHTKHTQHKPQRDAFERLQSNYGGFDSQAFLFVNAAIGMHDGIAILYRIKPDATNLPPWLPQIASFDRNVLMKHSSVVPNLESYIQTEEVQCMTFATLFKKTGIHHFDFLQIDAEGYDAELLRLFDVPSRKPAIIRFEHKHLSLNDHKQTLGSLVDSGYKFSLSGENTLAYLGQSDED